MALNKPTNYENPAEAGKDIVKTANLIEYLKTLYIHVESTDEKALRQYQDDYKKTKWSIVSYLSDEQKYAQWKSDPKNNAMMFFKYFKEGYFDHEIGQDQDLRTKILLDFKNIFETAPPEVSTTKEEIRRLQHYEANMVPPERRNRHEGNEHIIKDIYDRDNCFEKNYQFLLKNVPAKNQLSTDGNKIVELIKQKPLLLADNPYHYSINRDSNTYRTTTTIKLEQLLLDSSLGDPEAHSGVKKLSDTLSKLSQYQSVNDGIKTFRDKYSDDKDLTVHVDFKKK